MKHSNSVYCVVFTDPFHFLIDFYSNTKKTICLITKSNAHIKLLNSRLPILQFCGILLKKKLNESKFLRTTRKILLNFFQSHELNF